MGESFGKPESADSQQEGPWFDAAEPDYARRASALANRVDLTAAAAQFREKGFLIHDFGFPEEDLAEAAAFTRQIKRHRVQDGWLVNGAVKRLGTNPKVLAFLQDLYQREAFAFQTLNFPRGSQQKTHSDTWHFNSVPAGFMCGVWIALEDIHPDSGPLHYYAGSNRLPIFTHADVGDAAAYEGHAANAVKEAGLTMETAPIRRGQAFIWAANLFHGGTPIADPARTRLSQVTHYYFRGCSYFTPLASGGGRTFWREPYDIAAGRFVGNSDRAHRPRLHYRLGERLKIWARRPSGG